MVSDAIAIAKLEDRFKALRRRDGLEKHAVYRNHAVTDDSADRLTPLANSAGCCSTTTGREGPSWAMDLLKTILPMSGRLTTPAEPTQLRR